MWTRTVAIATKSTLALLASAAALAACTAPEGSKSGKAGLGPDGGSGGGSGGGFDGGSAPACALPTSYTAPSFGTNQRAANLGSGSGYTEELVWEGLLAGSGSGEQDIAVLAFSGGGSGSTGTPDWPTGNVTAKSNLDLTTDPDVIVEIATNFAMNGSGAAQTFYLADAGTLNITTASPSSTAAATTFAGNGSGLTLVHVDIGSNSVTLDPDNCMTTLPSFTFSAAVGSAAGGIKGDGEWTSVFRASRAKQ
jgi:hypothetical protein